MTDCKSTQLEKKSISFTENPSSVIWCTTTEYLARNVLFSPLHGGLGAMPPVTENDTPPN